MDREAWQAAVHRVKYSQTGLEQLSMVHPREPDSKGRLTSPPYVDL